MLGLRHYQGVAIDLWLGDITEFAVDAMVQVSNDPARLPDRLPAKHVIQAGDRNSYVYCLREAQRLQVQHISIPALSSTAETAQIAMQSVKDFIFEQRKRNTNLELKRLTFVLDEKPTYLLFQQALFSTFISEESE
ncbi:MAG: hypothetical protein KBD78_12305 [Oligoflexales bacterium]|nr:hypothetical protein [Oligoflexales bacterium]